MKFSKLKIPSTIPAPVKVGLYIVGGIVVWKYIGRPVLATFGLVKSGRELAFDKLAKDLARLPTNDGSTVPAITNLEATDIAGTIYQAMDKFGTDYDKIKDALIQLNGKDMQLVYKTFGVPKYFGTGHGTFAGDELDMLQWFTKEIGDEDQLAELRNIWARSGMKW